MPRLRPLAFLWCTLLAASPLGAQLPPLSVPKGLFRLELSGRFDNWDKTYFAGTKLDAASDFARDPATGGWLPTLGETERQLGQLSGSATPSLSLGKTTAHMLVNVGTESIGAAYGLTRRLTVFGTVPLVRVRVQNVLSLDATDANTGFNPAHPLFGTVEGQVQTNGFLGQLQQSLATLGAQLVSGAYDANPAQKAEAQATLQRGTTLQTDLVALLGSSPFLPIAFSPAAATLVSSVDSLRTRLLAVGNPGFTGAPAFPAAGLAQAGFEDFVTNPDGPIQGQAFEPPLLRAIGDIEVGASYAWLDRRPVRGLAVRSVLQGTVRLRTGTLDQPDAFFDRGTGDRQPDLQGDLVTDVGGGWLGARLTARYVLQLPARQERRLSPPDQPISPATSLAAVERDPGDIVEGALEPYLRIARGLALVAGVRHWVKGSDRYSYVSSQPPLPDTSPTVLATGSRENGTILSGALSFVHDGLRSDGTQGMPMDAILRAELVVGSGAGRVPARESISFMLRLYRKMF